MKQDFLEVGKITNTHGIMGEVRVEPWADSPDFLCRFETLYVGKTHWPIKVERARVHKNMAIVKFEGITDMNGALAMKNQVLHIARTDANLPEGHFFLADLEGLEVREADTGRILGQIAEVLTPPASNVYVVKGGERELLIPAVPEFVMETNVDDGYICVRLIDGM